MIFKNFINGLLLFALSIFCIVLTGCSNTLPLKESAAIQTTTASDAMLHHSPGFNPDIEYTISDGFPVHNLTPGSTAEYAQVITIDADSAFDYSINHSPTGIHLNVCLRAEDGTEYRTEVVGGTGEGTFCNLPEGSYVLAIEHLDQESRNLENAVVVFGIRQK